MRSEPPTGVSRRDFVKVGTTVLGGLAIGVVHSTLPSPAGAEQPASDSFQPNPILRLEPDGRVVVLVPRPDMGTGVRTAIAMMVAEELDADWSSIQVEQADLDETKYGPQYAGGSAVVRTSWDRMRNAGAVARAMLVEAAARTWNVPATECRTDKGAVLHAASGRRAPYHAFLALARGLPVPTDVPLKDPSGFTIIGKPTRSLDDRSIVTGRSTFGIDVRVPGMLVAVIERAPVLGARVGQVHDAAARAAAGVRHVVAIDADALPEFDENSPKMPNGVAVVATSTWPAMTGRRALRVDWQLTGGEVESTAKLREEAIARAASAPHSVARNDGDVDQALATAAHRHDAVYEVPLLAHATMEPMNCTAHVTAGRCEIWAPTQNPQGALRVAQIITGLPASAITVHVTRLGGGFGRRFYADFAGEAVYLSKAVGAPVQVVWSREDDTRHGFYRPAGYYAMRAGLDASGNIVAWSEHLVNASRGHFLRWKPEGGQRELDPGELEPYDLPANVVANVRIGYSPLTSRIPRGQWRAVEPSSTVFASQSMIDELAYLAGRDPLEYQLAVIGVPRELPYYGRHYDTGRLAAVFRLAAERAGWGAPLPRPRGRGIAGSYSNGAYVAHVVDVSVAADGAVRVGRVVSAADCGLVVNPLGARAQVEGAVVFGLSAALLQEITVVGGRVEQGNFQDYRVLRMRDAPHHEVHFVESSAPVSGMGEGALPSIAPALCNAIFAATGVRIRRLPVGRVRTAS